MKKIMLALLMALSIVRALADEGMWLPMLLGEQVYKEMVRKGLKLKPEQLYSMNQASIKDAIVIFGGGCTGEIVSAQGLLFTNHHCGYGAIASASSVENNYLRDGFWAADKSLEISSKGLSVRFLNRIDDVTARVEEVLGNATGADKARKMNEAAQKIASEATGGDEFKAAVVVPIFRGRQYLLYVYDVYKDVRLVGTPPESVGKFGGDTDNWEWPRHTGDFSVFRVYMSKDGRPANYSADNVPLKPKHFLPVSIKGFADGDYAMIFGYPGSTNRYETSYGVKLSTDINNPTLVKLRDMRLKYMFEEMKKDPAIKLQLASEYASVANYWKFYDGETKQLLKYDIYGQKKKTEDAFSNWAKGKPQYENVMADFAKAYDAWRPYAMHRQYFSEGIMGCRLIQASGGLLQLEAALMRQDNAQDPLKRAVEAVDAARKRYRENYNLKADQQILASVLLMFLNDIEPAQHPDGFYSALFRQYSSLDKSPFSAVAEDVFENSMMLDNEKWAAFKEKPSLEVLKKDPAFFVASAFIKNYQGMVVPKFNEFAAKNEELGRKYMDGLFEMDPLKMKATYPDANFTMRVSYGNVQSYKPKDAVTYGYVTTMSGILSKYKPGDYEFDLPQKLIELAKAKDYGRYADLVHKDLVVGFITNNDITGGNSGSPVINAKGELIGLAFDGNYEALSHKLAFDKDMIRTINVDVRYVLWCIEKLGGAKHIVDELKLVE
jgi:hypothetical protein